MTIKQPKTLKNNIKHQKSIKKQRKATKSKKQNKTTKTMKKNSTPILVCHPW